jgi:hypothetical protein
MQDSDGLARAIRLLVRLRQEAGVSASSAVRILVAERDQYVADITGTREVLRCKLGPKTNMGKHAAIPEHGWAEVVHDRSCSVWRRPV